MFMWTVRNLPLLAGQVWNRQSKVHALVTLGTPHLSQELYPFGRIKVICSSEVLPAQWLLLLLQKCWILLIDSFSNAWFQERLTGPDGESLPKEVEASSLQFANYFYEQADCFEDVKVVCIVGKKVKGDGQIVNLDLLFNESFAMGHALSRNVRCASSQKSCKRSNTQAMTAN